ncbi:SAM-dependent methyltransferase [Pseudomonas silensiensis]|nr:SAM-dependent methyltransferase [Pseudomonas silensiensis]
MKQTPDDLQKITATTLDHYNSVAEGFREGTRDHDVSQNIDALLRHIQGEAPFDILDFGCGPGRDLQTFTRMGHTAVGLDGSEKFAQMAREDSGCEVWQQDFLKLDLPDERFDGDFCQCGVVSYPASGIASGVEGVAQGVEARWRVVQFQSSRRESGRVEWAALWGLSRSCGVAAITD